MIDFDGGYCLTYSYRNGEEEAGGRLYEEGIKYISDSEVSELDVCPGHYAPEHMIKHKEIMEAQA